MSKLLRVFVYERNNGKLPEGFGDFLEQEQSPYHIIRPEEVRSPTSNGYHKMDEVCHDLTSIFMTKKRSEF